MTTNPTEPTLDEQIDWVKATFYTMPMPKAILASLVRLKTIEAKCAEQAKDVALWFWAETNAEAYLQRELRKLHAVIEGREIEFMPKLPMIGFGGDKLTLNTAGTKSFTIGSSHAPGFIGGASFTASISSGHVTAAGPTLVIETAERPEEWSAAVKEWREIEALKGKNAANEFLVNHLLAWADKYHTVNQLYIKEKVRAETAESRLAALIKLMREPDEEMTVVGDANANRHYATIFKAMSAVALRKVMGEG